MTSRFRAKHRGTQERAEPGHLPGPLTARDTEVAEAPRFTTARIAALRERLGFSQSVFAAALNVSAETVKAWEQGKRVPDGAVLRLLQLAEEHPKWITASVRPANRLLDTGPAKHADDRSGR